MAKFGRRIYYRKSTGEVIVERGQAEGSVKESTIEEDFLYYTQLKEVNKDFVGILQLEFNQYQDDFHRAKSYWVNPDNGKLEFAYTDSGETVPEYQAPLTDQVTELRARQDSTEAALLALMDVTNS